MTPSIPLTDDPREAALTDSTRAQITEVFDAAVREHKTAGITWAVVRDGDVLASGGAGVSDVVDGSAGAKSHVPGPDSISRIASMTKSFTAATILALRDEGKLSLDDPIQAHVPEASLIGRLSEDSPLVTIRHALTMSAGFVTDNPWGDRQESMTREELAEILAGGLSFVAEPGTRFEYSNTGYVLLGRVIDEVTGSDYRTEIRRRFLEPLQLHDTFFSITEATPPQRERLLHGHRVSDATGLAKFEKVTLDSTGVFGAMAGLFSTVRDVTTWVHFLSEVARNDGGRASSRELLSVASRRDMQHIHRIQDVPVSPQSQGYERVRGYGFGLVVEKSPLLGDAVSHAGGYPGYGSFMVWLRDSRLGVIALANSKYAPATACAMDALQIIARTQPELVQSQPIRVSARTLQALDAALTWLRTAPTETAYTGLVPDGTMASTIEFARHHGLDTDDVSQWFASNMDQDVSRAERLRLRDAALTIAGLDASDLTRERATHIDAISPYQARLTFEGPRGTVRIDLLMDPRREGAIQALNVKGTPHSGEQESGGAPIGI